TVDLRLRGGQVGREAEIGEPQVFNPGIAEMLGEEMLDAPAADQANKRQGVVGQRALVGEGLAGAAARVANTPARREAGSNECGHAGAAAEIDGHAVLDQSHDDPKMRIGARSAARQYEAERATSEDARHASPVGVLVYPQMEVAVDRQHLEERHGYGRPFS